MSATNHRNENNLFFITDKLYFYSVRNLKHDFHHNSIMFAILIALLWEVKITIKSAVGMITTAGCRHLVRLTPVELGNIWRWRVAEIKHLHFELRTSYLMFILFINNDINSHFRSSLGREHDGKTCTFSSSSSSYKEAKYKIVNLIHAGTDCANCGSKLQNLGNFKFWLPHSVWKWAKMH